MVEDFYETILPVRFEVLLTTMLKKILPYLLLVILAIILLVVKQCNNKPGSTAKPRVKQNENEPQVNRNRGFNRRVTYLEYTRHAKCRMQCRHITQKEVEAIMQQGNINYRKSNVSDMPCPTYALEGNTDDGQQVRIVFAQCDNKTKVVTCIDLDNEYSCDCN
jgi:Domain of unknown function (DUF4258)